MKNQDLSHPDPHQSTVDFANSQGGLDENHSSNNTVTASNMIPVPNQSNAFFASGFNMVDPTVNGGLEKVNKRRVIAFKKSKLSVDQHQ